MVLIMCAAVVVSVIGVIATGHFDASNLQPAYGAEGKSLGSGFVSILALAPFLYVGFDCIPQAAEEYDFPPQKCKMLIISALIVGALIYGAMALVTDCVVPWQQVLLIASGGPEGANGLEDLHQQHQQDDADDHNVGLVAVVAVGKGDLAQAAAANDTGHGRVAQNGGQCGGHAGDQAGQAFRDHHLGNDLERRCAHALGRFHHALVQLAQAGLHQTCHERELPPPAERWWLWYPPWCPRWHG